MAPIHSMLETRQSSDDNCPSTITGGGIAGIVIGSIAGTLLILWLWRILRLPGVWKNDASEVVYQAPVIRSSTKTRGRRHRRRPPATYVDYAEKPASVRSSRRYSDRDDLRRPARVYRTEG
ncbi:hypothetical protein DTO006G1_2028 [Penicillium roqueforti]|nr:hypothetical protein CBS147354_5741 [Penicillium roqueforti]KAI2762889.1 hypothetical protein DTO006G1_2028 [Penicillium roqueforti]KAI3133757.1 hypothetical protein CBS147326_4869 [Penicillium roqueforti]KAI3255792.1 hypothetical protein DTO006G7_3642 [Penicillium roqueforti]